MRTGGRQTRAGAQVSAGTAEFQACQATSLPLLTGFIRNHTELPGHNKCLKALRVGRADEGARGCCKAGAEVRPRPKPLRKQE